jgi:thioredoxin reductase
MVAPQPSCLSDAEVLDAIVIGGGPAGLSAALVLGRCLRRVLVCDAGHPRNEPARIFNGFLSRDGSTPAEFLQICRDQLRRYETIEFRKVKVVGVEHRDEHPWPLCRRKCQPRRAARHRGCGRRYAGSLCDQ